MTYMLDTNICIYIMKHNKNVIRKFNEKRNNGIALSSITLAELEYGICKSVSRENNERTLLSFLALVDILPFDDNAAIEYGKIRADLERKGKIIGSLDMLIAAHAKSNGYIIATNNADEFRRVDGLDVENWAD